MTKIIAVTGATGTQGGGVVNVMKNVPGWKVRAITRNTSSDGGKKLAAEGIEVVQADFNDEASLIKAFQGAHAVFAVTNFWEHLFTGSTQSKSGELEAAQAKTLAHAASKTSTLEHYIWSTLPSAEKITNGKHPVPHLDYKASVDEYIKKELPSLASKTTFLFFGYYTSNVAFFPMIKPFEYPGAFGKWVQVLPTNPDAKIPVTGDMTIAPGAWVRQILANPSLTHGKYANVATEVISFNDMIKQWSEVTGRSGVIIQSSRKDFAGLWGPPGDEIALQLEFGEVIDDWHAGIPFVSMEELGIKREEVGGFKEAFEKLKQFV